MEIKFGKVRSIDADVYVQNGSVTAQNGSVTPFTLVCGTVKGVNACVLSVGGSGAKLSAAEINAIRRCIGRPWDAAPMTIEYCAGDSVDDEVCMNAFLRCVRTEAVIRALME
ncbi:MAG: hypothetical protein LBB38_03210 [Puniceicoccales bacterium]|jgi:hypothetical protein|nr:hypothetical protein [Puniceicoccales bacterium]